MNVKKVFVTGAGGFIGLEVCRHLVARGYSVTGVDVRYPADARVNGADLHVGDYRDEAIVEPLLAGHDAVIHLASAHLDVGLSDSVYWDVNVHGLAGLMGLAVSAGIQVFCHVSSVSVYGNLAVWPANEETECHPQSIYGETKLAGEQAVRVFSEETGLNAVILRPTWVYGATCPRTKRLYDALRNRKFFMIGPGTNVRHPIYIEDLLRAFDLVFENPSKTTETFIIGGEEIVSTKELIATMCDVFDLPEPRLRIPYRMGAIAAGIIESGSALIGARPPVSRRTLEFFNTNNGFDISRARDRLGFEPRFGLSDGFSDCRAALRAGTTSND